MPTPIWCGHFCYFPASSIFSISTPYPIVGSFTSTCVTAPTSFPFCRIGLPLMPCTMPPVFASSASSVTVMSRFRPFFASGSTRSMRMEKRWTCSPSTLDRISAAPVVTAEAGAV